MRLIEFIQGYNGYVITHEVFLYGFDALPMFLAVVTMNVIHLGEVARHLRTWSSVRKVNMNGCTWRAPERNPYFWASVEGKIVLARPCRFRLARL
jgi:hypothetical protein